jgi:uncharacterized integral membrane protein
MLRGGGWMRETTQSGAAPEGMRDAQSREWATAFVAVSANGEANPEAVNFFRAIREADDYVAGSLFARVVKFATPFTQQYKTTQRYRVPQYKDIYDEADKLQTRCAWRYSALRAITALLFAVFLLIATDAFDIDTLFGGYAAGAGSSAIAALVAGIVLTLCRLGVRKLFLDFYIDKPVWKLAHYMSAKYNRAVAETNAACGQIESRTDFGTGLGWAQRAMGWSKIAQWNAVKTRALDGYTTVVFWKIQVFDTNTERSWRLIKGFLLVAGLSVLFYEQGDGAQRNWIAGGLPVLLAAAAWACGWYFIFLHRGKRIRRKWPVDFFVLLALYAVLALVWVWHGGGANWTPVLTGMLMLAVFWFGWIVLDERDDAMWTDKFVEELHIDDITGQSPAFYFNSVAVRFQNLVEEVIDAERSPRGNPPPRP